MRVIARGRGLESRIRDDVGEPPQRVRVTCRAACRLTDVLPLQLRQECEEESPAIQHQHAVTTTCRLRVLIPLQQHHRLKQAQQIGGVDDGESA